MEEFILSSIDFTNYLMLREQILADSNIIFYVIYLLFRDIIAFSYFLYFTVTPIKSDRQMKWMLFNLLSSLHIIRSTVWWFKKCDFIWF